MKHIWFAAKRYGYGWYPVTWEGWALVLGFVVMIEPPPSLLLLLHIRMSDTQFVSFFLPYVAVLVSLLLWVCVKKGEKARWRWGK